MPNLTAPASAPAANSGSPNSRCSPSAAPTSSARSVAVAITSARSQSAMVSRRGKRSRHTSARFLAVAIPSLALIDWISIAIRVATTITHTIR